MRNILIAFFLSALVSLLFPSSALALRFTDDSYFVPKGVVGKPYNHVFELAKGGGSPPYHYVIANDGKLPPGLTLGREDGKVSGTPLASGKWSIWLHGIDSGLQHGFWDMQTEREFTFEILPALGIRQPCLEPTVLNRPYSVKLGAEGGGTQAWSVDSGTLPKGISLASDGTLWGTATAPGHFTFVVKVTDSSWNEYAVGTRKQMAGFRSDTRTLVLWVAEVGIELPAKGISPLEAGSPMSEAGLIAFGGTAPYRWALAGAVKLPAGLTLDPAQGTISGTPETPGSFALTIHVKDANGLVGIAGVPLEVRRAGDRK
jgi:hypothetical protein